MKFVAYLLVVCCLIVNAATVTAQDASAAFQRVKQHEFHPLNEDGSFTSDRERKTHGVADLTNDDWRVRLLAIRDVVRSLPTAIEVVKESLTDENQHVRQIAAAAIGIAGPASSHEVLMTVLVNDASALVRAQAAMSLGQLQARPALALLRKEMNEDASKDVRHQCELAIDQIEKEMGVTAQQLDAFRSLDANNRLVTDATKGDRFGIFGPTSIGVGVKHPPLIMLRCQVTGYSASASSGCRKESTSPVPKIFDTCSKMPTIGVGGERIASGGARMGGTGTTGGSTNVSTSRKLLPLERPPAKSEILRMASLRGSVAGSAANVRTSASVSTSLLRSASLMARPPVLPGVSRPSMKPCGCT